MKGYEDAMINAKRKFHGTLEMSDMSNLAREANSNKF